MHKKLLLLCSNFILLCLPVITAQAASHCTGLDIAFSTVTLTGVGNGKISYDVTITNIGTQTIVFNKLTLKNYISTDNTYDGSDVSGGNALFSAFASGTSVLAGQQKTATYYGNYSGDIKSIGYLILQLSYQDAECDATNNQIVVCTKPNPVLNDIAITEIDATSGQYDATITNTGGDTLFLSKTVLQNYVSTDNAIGDDDAAGGSILNYGAKQYLLANESCGMNQFGFDATNMSNYSYVIAGISYGSSSCGSGNQLIKALVVTVTGTEESQDATNNAVVWDMSSNSFTTKDKGEWTGSITYQVFDLSGRMLTKGKTTPGERVYIPEGSGLAILTVADDQHTYSQKIVR